MINPWTPDVLDEWSQWWMLALTPAVAWRRAWQAAYRPRPRTSQRPAIVTPLRPPTDGPRVVVTEVVEPPVFVDADAPPGGLYAAMTAAELGEVAAFHATAAAYQQALDDLHAADRPTPAAQPVAPRRAAPRGALPSIGESATTSRTFRRDDVLRFAELTGDRNPLHVEPGAWVGTPFSGNLVHGIFTAALFSQLLGMELPGPGAVYLSQTLKFTAPVYIGETVTARVTVVAVREDKRLITLETRAEVTRDSAPVSVVEGEALIKLLHLTPEDESAA